MEYRAAVDAAVLLAEEVRELGDVVRQQGQAPAEERLPCIVSAAAGSVRGRAQADRAEHAGPEHVVEYVVLRAIGKAAQRMLQHGSQKVGFGRVEMGRAAWRERVCQDV